MIEIRGLVKKFGSFTALDNINFKVQKGEIVTLLGPNGAGKSTLMRCICGCLLPDAGEILIKGKKLREDLLFCLEKIGYMPENTPLYPEMSVAEYLRFTGKVFQMSDDDFKKNLSLMIEKLDLSSVMNKKISTLSKGYRRRTGVAGAMIHRPEILILDEPTEGLDPNQKQALREFLKEYSLHSPVIISTHLLEEAENLSSRVLILNNGKLIRDTDFKDLKKQAPRGNLNQLFYELTNGGKNV
ncbi:MAG: ABC transporter ATP-binding protein [Alphaproteobacteria bacterium]|nr:ABC transporter ATP-binding protein [Alphaproteobacteria bacterium]